MGEVWSAVHNATRRQVAIKRLFLPSNARRQDQARARFTLEAQAACAVEHPNVVEILDFVDVPGEPPMIVMELLQGETLATRLGRVNSLALEEAATIISQVVSAVGTAHALGIVHRDLKPSNIFLNELGDPGARVKILDFGIAKWLGQSSSQFRTQTGATPGTPAYMAPEQAIAQYPIDQRVDIWSLGVIVYECLTGVRPVEGENVAQVLMRLMSTGIMPIEHLLPTLPRDICELVGRMLRRKPESRTSDLREVALALSNYSTASAPSFGGPCVTGVVPTL